MYSWIHLQVFPWSHFKGTKGPIGVESWKIYCKGKKGSNLIAQDQKRKDADVASELPVYGEAKFDDFLVSDGKDVEHGHVDRTSPFQLPEDDLL